MRKLLESNFNLSKTEFIAYLQCPLKFYLLKELNKDIDKSKRKDYSDYEPNLVEGINKHLWYKTFYKKFGRKIQDESYLLSNSNLSEPWKKKFIDFEIKRYREQSSYWEPVALELFLKTTEYRGQIDRIDQLDEQGNCRIVEYKPHPSEFDEEELLFYSVLVNELLPLKEIQTVTKVSEIGVYYYSIGQFYKAKITAEKIQTFGIYLKKIRRDMLNCYKIKKKKDCDLYSTDCLYREICQRTGIKHQKIVEIPIK